MTNSRARHARGGLRRALRSQPRLLRAGFAVLAAVAVAVSGVLLGPVPKAMAAAGEETIWIGPLTGGEAVWDTPTNWSNGIPVHGSIVAFDTPAQLKTPNMGLRGSTLDFRPGSSGIRLSASHEYRPSRIVVGEGVSVELDLRLLQIGQHSEMTIAMSDDSLLSLTRQVQPDVFVESTKLVDGSGPQQADLVNAVIRIGSGDWLTAPIHLGGNVRLELDKRMAGDVREVSAPVANESETASPTAGRIVLLRDEQLFADSVLDLSHGLSLDLNGNSQTVGALTLADSTAALSGGQLTLNTDGGAGTITATGEGTSVVSGGTVAVQGSAPAAITVGTGTLEIQSMLQGTADLTLDLGGGTLILGDACTYTGTITVSGTGAFVATNGFGGVVQLIDGAEYVDGSLGGCASATVPPGPPTRVTATALRDRVGARITWQWPTTSGTNTLQRFELYRSADPAALGTKIADMTLDMGGNVFEYLDEWSEDDYLEGWTTYYYRVKSVSTTSVSVASDQVSVVTLGAPLPPQTVRVLNGSGKVKLSWSPSPVANVEGYRVYRSTTYAAPSADDPWAGTEPPAWSTPYGVEDGHWELVADVRDWQLELLDDFAGASQAGTDTVVTPGFPLERTWNYYVTAYADGFGESDPAVVVAGTPSSQVELSMSVFQEVDAYPGTTAVFAADVSNLGDGPTSGDLTARLLIPSMFPVRVIDPATQSWVIVAGSGTAADGDGDGVADWTCGRSTIGDTGMLRCTYATDLAGMSTSVPLPFSLDIPREAALGTVQISYAVSGANSAGELGSASNKPFGFEVEAIKRASLEVLTTFDGQLSADAAAPALIEVAVRNTGTAATTAPPTVTVAVPDGSRLGSGYGSDAWTCTQSAAGADIVCVGLPDHVLGGVLMPGAVSPEVTIPLLTRETPWSVGSREALPIAITASAPDSYGTVTAGAQLTGTPGLGEAPALLVEVETSDPAALPAGTSAFQPAVTNGGGETLEAPLRFVLRLPDGVEIDLATVSSAWDCVQTGTTVECVSTTPRTLAAGQRVTGPLLTTRPMSDALTLAGHWRLDADASHDGILSEPVTALVEIAPLPVPATTTLTIQPRHAQVRSGQPSSVAITLAGDVAAGTAPARAFAALLPAAVEATRADITLTGFGSTTTAAWGDCHIAAPGEGPFPGAGQAVLCHTTTPVPQSATAVVEVDFTAGQAIEGDLTFATGFLDVADETAALAALRDAGAGALLEASVAAVTGIAFIANAGAPQTVGATVIVQDADGEPVNEPTPVRLAGTITGAGTDAVAYCWQQLSGPELTWVEGTAAGAVVPGTAGLPAFPAGSPVNCVSGGFDADADHWFGEAATFLAPQVRDGAEVTLRLLVTDGVAVAEAQTTVTVGPAGNSTPVIEDLALLERDGTDWVEVADVAAAQIAGTPLRLRVRVSDLDGDRVTLTPWLISPRSAGVVFTAASESTSTVHLLDFVWPTAVDQLEVGLTATDGFAGPGGEATAVSATVSLGPTPETAVAPAPSRTGYILPVTAKWVVAPGLDLEGWVANGPIDVEAGVFGIGTEIVHPLAIPDPDAPVDPEAVPEPETLWQYDPLTLSRVHLTVVDTAPLSCSVAAEAPAGSVILAIDALADIDWNGRDTIDRNFQFAVVGCIVPGVGWNLTNAAPIKRMDIEDVPKTLTFREVSFVASRLPARGGDFRDSFEFVGSAQSQGAEGPATMAVWVPERNEPGQGATRFALWVEASMADLSLHYGGDGYLVYTPERLNALSEIPGFTLDRGSDHSPPECTGGTTRHEDIPVTAGFSAVASYQVDAIFCDIMAGIGISMAGSMPMITPISALPMGTIYLSGGASTLIDGEDAGGVAVKMTGVRLVYHPVYVQLIADGELSLPNLLHTISLGKAGSPSDRSTLDVGVGVTFGTNFIKEHTAQAFIQKTGDPWLDAFGVAGLDVGDLTLQGGMTFQRKVLGPDKAYKAFPDWAYRAEILGLPLIMEQALGIVGDEPIVLSARISKQTPIYDMQLGIVDGNPFMKLLKGVSGGALEDVLVVDGGHLIFSPFGGTIGDRVYPWGVTFEAGLEIFGFDVGLRANVDLWAFHMDADIELGRWSVGGVTMTETRLAFELDALEPTATFVAYGPESIERFARSQIRLYMGHHPPDPLEDWGGGGDSPPDDPVMAMVSTVTPSATAAVGPAAPAAPEVRPRADDKGDPVITLDFAAALEDISLGGVATIHDAQVWSHREIPISLGIRVPPAAFDMGMSATVGVFGHEVAVIGAVDIDSAGLKGYDLIGASEPLDVFGTTFTGSGCGDVSGILPDGATPPSFPTNGPCFRVSVRPGTMDPIRLAMSGSLAVPSSGIEATFDGQVDGSGLAIELAKVQLTSAITAKLTDARFYYGPRVAAGLVTDTNANGSTVTVGNGDFRLRGAVNTNLLGGFAARLDVDLGKIGSDAWANAAADLALFADKKSPIQSSVRLAGAFAKRGGAYEWELGGTGTVSIGGFKATGVDFSMGQTASDEWFSLAGVVKAGPVSARISGDIAWADGVRFELVGTTDLKFFGSTAASAKLSLSYGPKMKLKVEFKNGRIVTKIVRDAPTFTAELGFSGSMIGLIRLTGTGTISSNGDFCASGQAKIANAFGGASVCHQGGKWSGLAWAEPWQGFAVAAALTSMHDFIAAGKLTLPKVKKGVNMTIEGVGLSGDFVVKDMELTVGVASKAGSVCVRVKNGKCKESVNFSGAGVYVKGSANFKVHGCAKGGGLGSKCGHAQTGADFKLNPVKFCGSKRFKVLIHFTISGCYEPPSKLYTR